MIPQILLNALQTGGKFFLDLDPSLTEHLSRNFSVQAAAIIHGGIHAITQIGSRCNEDISAILKGCNSIELQMFEG